MEAVEGAAPLTSPLVDAIVRRVDTAAAVHSDVINKPPDIIFSELLPEFVNRIPRDRAPWPSPLIAAPTGTSSTSYLKHINCVCCV